LGGLTPSKATWISGLGTFAVHSRICQAIEEEDSDPWFNMSKA
jgi:hypothetical protein